MNTGKYPVSGAGLGLRRALLGPLRSGEEQPGAHGSTRDVVDFMEVAPENWINVGGRFGRAFREFTSEYPFVCHGLSLSIGGPNELDETFLHRLKRFLDDHGIRCYSEHLSYCTDNAHLYDLMPIPFTEEAVNHVALRVKRVQDILERRIALENVSYYAAPGQEMSEIEFLNAVLEESDCDLLLDVNNIYVNSINHRYDAVEFLRSMPGHRIAYGHVAGHYNEAEDLIVDTHGADVIPGVWQLLDAAYEAFGVFPTLLERDFNIPDTGQLFTEVEHIRELQMKHSEADATTRIRA